MREVALVGERDLLTTIASPDSNYELLVRASKNDPESTGAMAARYSAEIAIVFAERPGEIEAIEATGTRAIRWGPARFPVADELFSLAPPDAEPRRVFFSGPTSERRDRFLQPVKHRFDVLHLAAGADLPRLRDLMNRCTIAIDFAPEEGLPLVDRIGPAAAAGMLVIAERPVDRAGLDEGIDSIGFSDPDELELLISDATREPEAFLGVRQELRRRAEAWRSSDLLSSAVAGD